MIIVCLIIFLYLMGLGMFIHCIDYCTDKREIMVMLVALFIFAPVVIPVMMGIRFAEKYFRL